MKLTFMMSASLLLLSGTVLAMQPEPTIQSTILDDIIADEAACQDMSDLAKATFNSLPDLDDPRYLEAVLKNLTKEQSRLIDKINATLEKLKTMDNRALAEELAFKCYESLKLIKGYVFVEIESRILDLGGSLPNSSSSNPTAAQRSENLNKQQELEEARRLAEEENARNALKEAAPLNLPASLGGRAVFHMRADQLQEFCCGYNVLFNGCNIESTCGIPNRFSDYGNFRQACFDYIRPRAIKPLAAVYGIVVESLAEHFLNMQQTCALVFDGDNKIIPLTYGSTMIFVPHDATKAEIDHLHSIERIRLRAEKIAKIWTKLANSTAPCDIVHFFCYNSIGKDGHFLLATLVQNPTGRGLYIYDNTNRPITEDTQSERLLLYICDTFNISRKDQFSGPRIPEIWPSFVKYRTA